MSINKTMGFKKWIENLKKGFNEEDNSNIVNYTEKTDNIDCVNFGNELEQITIKLEKKRAERGVVKARPIKKGRKTQNLSKDQQWQERI